MSKSYVKDCFTENWDKYQLRMATYYGNKPFFDFMKVYKIERHQIEVKYRTVAAKYYRDRINAETAEIEFNRNIPTRNEGRMPKRTLQALMASNNKPNTLRAQVPSNGNRPSAKNAYNF